MNTNRAQIAGSMSQLSESQRVLEALERGELVHLMAEVDNGMLNRRYLEEALEEYERKHWMRRVFAALLGRKVS